MEITEIELAGRAEFFNLKPLEGLVRGAVEHAYRLRTPFARAIAKLAGTLDLREPMAHIADRGTAPTVLGGSTDAPETSLPLPLTWADVPAVPAAADPNDPKCLYAFETAARRVGEKIERMFLGLEEPFLGRVHGVCNYPNRTTMTYDLGKNWLTELVLRAANYQRGLRFYGPWLVLVGKDGASHLEEPPPAWSGVGLGDSLTVRDTILRTGEGADPGNKEERVIVGTHTVPYPEWPADRVALVQVTPEVIRAVHYLDVRAVLWKGVYRVAVGTVPQLRADHLGNSGVLVAHCDSPHSPPLAPPEADAPVSVLGAP